MATEINHAVGSEAVLMHHVFRDAEALGHYFSNTTAQHMQALHNVAKPEHHLVCGNDVPTRVIEAINAKGVPATFCRIIYGYVKDDYQLPDADKTRVMPS